jgi:hypothetical protein
VDRLALLRQKLERLGDELAEVGIRIDPQHPPDLMILAQLCVVPSDLEWDEAISSQSLVMAGPHTYADDGRGTRDRSNCGVSRPDRVGRIQRAVLESQPSYRDIRATSSDAGRRSSSVARARMTRRLEAIRQAVEETPALQTMSARSAGRLLFDGWGRDGAGRRLADLMEERLPPVGPDQLAKDLEKVRSQRPGG